jgi:hypothetical protein
MSPSIVKGHVLAVFPNLRNAEIRLFSPPTAGTFIYTYKGMMGGVPFETKGASIVGYHDLTDEWIAQGIVSALCDAGVKP